MRRGLEFHHLCSNWCPPWSSRWLHRGTSAIMHPLHYPFSWTLGVSWMNLPGTSAILVTGGPINTNPLSLGCITMFDATVDIYWLLLLWLLVAKATLKLLLLIPPDNVPTCTLLGLLSMWLYQGNQKIVWEKVRRCLSASGKVRSSCSIKGEQGKYQIM